MNQNTEPIICCLGKSHPCHANNDGYCYAEGNCQFKVIMKYCKKF